MAHTPFFSEESRSLNAQNIICGFPRAQGMNQLFQVLPEITTHFVLLGECPKGGRVRCGALFLSGPFIASPVGG